MRSDWLLRARAILNRQWDPIHLSRMPDADEWDWADEYDQYGDQLPVDRERNARVVAALRTLGMPPPFVISGPDGSLR